MTGKIIRIGDYKTMNPNNEFYNLPLEARFQKYQDLTHEIYDKRKTALEPFDKNESSFPEKRLTPEELTAELTGIVPSFDGNVLGRFFFPSVALHYILEPKEMESLFGESPFGRYTGKVIGDADGLLAPEHSNLSGLVIVQAKQETSEKDRFIASHEAYHSTNFHNPNGVRRDNYAQRLKNANGLSQEELVDIMIGLDQAILIDEAGASIRAYDSLGDEQRNRFRGEYIQELRDASRNILGFQLNSARISGTLDEPVIQRINQHELASIGFSIVIKQSVENLADTLQNPERLEPLGYAMSYVGEALQILDFDEIPEGLESLCLEVLEPHRLYR